MEDNLVLSTSEDCPEITNEETLRLIEEKFHQYALKKHVDEATVCKYIHTLKSSLPRILIANNVVPNYTSIFKARDTFYFHELLNIFTSLTYYAHIDKQCDYGITRALEQYIKFFSSDSYPHDAPISPVDDEADETQRTEGRVSEARILRRKRNRKARQQCLEQSGYVCYVCGFNFEKVYGERGRQFLEVHHKKPLATYDDEHVIPLSELCALCSNCHSMVHRTKEVMDVDKLKEIVEKNRQTNR